MLESPSSEVTPNPRPVGGFRWQPVAAMAAGLTLAWFVWLMLRITWQYWPIRPDAAFLQLKSEYVENRVWYAAFYVHVATSLFALAAGLTQFWPQVTRRWPAVHRGVGRLYAVVVCLVSGPAGLVLARYANGGISSRIGFSLLGVGWIGFTALAYTAAKERRWSAHRSWMIRSYALTLAAVTLRAWKLGLVLAFHPAPMDVYRVVAWLGFLPNLVVAEWLIRRTKGR